MSNPNLQTDEDIFTAALAIESIEAQNQYVAAACDEDAQQRERVLSLLQSHRKLAYEDAAFVLDRPEEVCSELIGERPFSIGEQIGPYRIMQLLGEGGMGLVYQAEQITPIRRRVALKLLKPGMDSEKVLARFELERQALAGMDHPGITRILDAGIADSGRPYFVMELVKGISITEYCRTHHLQALDCIQLMIHVCNAIQHAHQRGIIHRDIKPSNVLVAQGDNGPIPKIIDFGIAKLINDSMNRGDHFTLHGEMIGTPEYMSPEQALSNIEEVDTRSDVYSIGVLLYELLTGETPLAGAPSDGGLTKLRQFLRNSKIELPSHRLSRSRPINTPDAKVTLLEDSKSARFLRGDVDCIVMKALARDPIDRYQSVSELKRDLERFVSGLPIEAVPPRFLYQLKKLVNRHRVIASVASLACVLVLAASTVAILFGLVANDRLRDVLAMQSELEVERDRAIVAERKARLLAQTYLAPSVLDQSIRRFCIEHWDQLLEVNPKLTSLPRPSEKEHLDPEIQATIFGSNLFGVDERLLNLGEPKWLVKILSDISKKDLGQLFAPIPISYSVGEAAPVESDDAAPVAAPSVLFAQPVPTEMASSIDPSSVSQHETTFKFPLAAEKAYLTIFCEELRAIDPQLPMVSDAEISIGLCLMDMQRPDLALPHFRESLRILESFPELYPQTLQARLFIANCLKQLGNQAESKQSIAQIRSEISTNPSNLDAMSIKQLNKLADDIEQINVLPSSR